jgi:hypothetical protein
MTAVEGDTLLKKSGTGFLRRRFSFPYRAAYAAGWASMVRSA